MRKKRKSAKASRSEKQSADDRSERFGGDFERYIKYERGPDGKLRPVDDDRRLYFSGGGPREIERGPGGKWRPVEDNHQEDKPKDENAK